MECPRQIVGFDVWRYAYFVVILLAVYGIVRGVGDSGVFDWDIRVKDADQNFQDILSLVALGTLVFVFGNYAQTFDSWTAASMVILSLVWMWISNLEALRSSLVSIRSWSPAIWGAVGSLAALVATGLLYMFWLGFGCHILLQMGLLIVGFAGVLATLFLLRGKATFHLHHWQIFWALAFLAPFNTTLSKVAGGGALAVFASAIAQYGPDPAIPEAE